MKNFVAVCALALVSFFAVGCNSNTAAVVAENAISVTLDIAVAETPAIPVADQAGYTNFVTLAQGLDKQLTACVAASGSTSAKFLTCFNSFSSGLLSPAELAALRVLSPESQQKVQIYVTAAIAALNIAITSYQGTVIAPPTVAVLTPASQVRLAAVEVSMREKVGY